MGWSDGPPSGRRAELPRDWQKRRRAVLARDGGCCRFCGGPASHVDHIVRGQDHSLGNLRALCESCHMSRTGRDGGSALRRERRKWRRWSRPHPGLRE